MLLLGHLAITTFALYLIGLIKSRKIFGVALVGAVLPDLIDKPLSYILFQSFINGRLIAHTLVFTLILLTVFLVLIKLDKMGKPLIVFPLAAMLHIVEDRMWMQPQLFFYPFFMGKNTP